VTPAGSLPIPRLLGLGGLPAREPLVQPVQSNRDPDPDHEEDGQREDSHVADVIRVET
jgi:hypothetical protein